MRGSVRLMAGVVGCMSLLTGCMGLTAGIPTVRESPGSAGSAGSPGSPGMPPSVHSNATPRAGDCVGYDHAQTGNGIEVWVTGCTNADAVSRVVRVLPNGQANTCITDDYVGFQFDPSTGKPSLCLMLYGNPGDCYGEFNTRVALGPRVACTDPKATLRVADVIRGQGRATCPNTNDPQANALFYSAAPAPNGGRPRDVTFCLASPT